MKGKGNSGKKKNGDAWGQLLNYAFWLIITLIIAYVILNKDNLEARFGYGGKGVTGEIKTVKPETGGAHPQLKVNQEVGKVEGEVTGVKAPGPPQATGVDISVTQKAGVIEGSMTGVDMKKIEEKK